MVRCMAVVGRRSWVVLTFVLPLLVRLASSSRHVTVAEDTVQRSLAKVCSPPPDVDFAQVEVTTPVGSPHGPYVIGSVAYYHCKPGYVLTNSEAQFLHCVDGQWEGEQPKCQPPCSKPGVIPNSKCTVYTTTTPCDASDAITDLTRVYYSCEDGYVLVGSAVRQCTNGEWIGARPSCELRHSKSCPSPPLVEHAEYSLYQNPKNEASGSIHPLDGSSAVYSCHNGYTFENNEMSVDLTCRGGRWIGDVPNCIKRLHCYMPRSIPNGNWVILSEDTKFSIGTKIMYECSTGFALFGSKIIECSVSGYWSDAPPKCLAKGMYCDPGVIENGFFVCTPEPCSMIHVGISISYVCQTGYEPIGNVQRTCISGGVTGVWSGPKPTCLPIPTTPRTDMPLGINSNTMTVVIATSCSVLGLLLVIMVVVALQRRKPSTRLCHPVQQAPPMYPRPRTDSLDEHDRVALIAVADGVQVVLPSYEEATRGRGGSSTPRYLSDGSSIRRGDYRPLPTIPANMRTPNRHDSPRPGPLAQDHHRNSIITNCSNARDNISLVFGSMDTMNISDGTSTSVTIETFDSGASNPSLALSQRAAAGSLGSSNGSLANEDAPLLDSVGENGRNQGDTSPTPEDQHKPE